MTENWSERERSVLESLASRYRDRGYDVLLDHVVEGTRSTRVDLIARRGNETTLVEVKRIREGREPESKRSSLETLAELAAERGWKVTIVLVRDDTFDEVDVLSRPDVRQLVEDAATIATSSWIAVLATIAAFEAAARFALTRIGRVPRPGAIGHLQALASGGLVSTEEEMAIQKLIVARNAAAHGMPATEVPAADVARVLGVSARLVDPEPAAA